MRNNNLATNNKNKKNDVVSNSYLEDFYSDNGVIYDVPYQVDISKKKEVSLDKEITTKGDKLSDGECALLLAFLGCQKNGKVYFPSVDQSLAIIDGKNISYEDWEEVYNLDELGWDDDERDAWEIDGFDPDSDEAKAELQASMMVDASGNLMIAS